MNLARLILAGAVASALAMPAFAHGKRGFDAIDKNDDGVISKAEAAASPRLLARFDAVDKNNDGKVSRAEYRAWTTGKPVRSASGFNRLDTNHDGYLTRAEARHDSALAKRFRSADRNHDGRLNRAEYAAAMTSIHTAQRRDEPHASAGGTRVPPP